jgi:predicted aldo/keto reductase-like oxidoreductase
MGYIEGLKQFATSTGITSETGSSPGLCIKCGKCEPLCPQKIPIMKDLVIVRKKLEPWFIKLIGVCARAFLGKKRKKTKSE